MLAFERLVELVTYCPDTGEFRRRSPAGMGDRYPVGSLIGWADGGYLCVEVDNRKYRLHRLAWLYMTGKWPSHEIDHRDGDRSNNKWLNLREATDQQNAANKKTNIRNQCGLKGVRRDRKKWIARIMVNYAPIYLGSFDSPKEAHVAYCDAAKRYHGEYASVGR